MTTDLEVVPLTPAQLAALCTGSACVEMIAAHSCATNLDALTQALMELRRRHPVLRMIVRHRRDGPVGAVGTQTAVPVELISDPSDASPVGHFDLTSGPLLHVAIRSGGATRTLLRFRAHPLVLDEQGMRQAIHEAGLLYRHFADGGPLPPVARHQRGERTYAAGRRPRRQSVVFEEIDPAAADRVRMIAASRGLPVALLVLAAWLATGSSSSRVIAASLPNRLGRPPLGPTSERVLLRTAPAVADDLVALAEQLRTAASNSEPDDGQSPVTFTFDDTQATTGPFSIVESNSSLLLSDLSLEVYGTPGTGWHMRLSHSADAESARAARTTLSRTVKLLVEIGASLVDEELL